jgi:hypothetical protein
MPDSGAATDGCVRIYDSRFVREILSAGHFERLIAYWRRASARV